MATKAPLVLVDGRIQQLQAGDTLEQPRLNLGATRSVVCTGGSIAYTDAIMSISGDSVDTISGGTLGDFLIVKGGTLNNETGNLSLGGANRSIGTNDTAALIFNGSRWLLATIKLAP